MPALAATVSVNPTVVLPGQQATIQLVMNNQTVNTATIVSIQPQVTGSGTGSAPINMGVPPYGQGLLSNISANASVQLNWSCVANGPTMLYQGGSPASSTNPGNMNVDTNPASVDAPVYVIGALIQTSDGIVSVATAQNMKVVNSYANLPVTPANGQLRFDSSFNSGLEVLGLM